MRVQRQRHLYSIFDSKASPAGLSNVLWKPGRSDDYDIRETQVCRAWDVELGIELPLLPLKNTISASEDQDSKQANSRRMLVNTEAYVLSYRFGGAFAAPDTTDVHGAFTNTEHFASADMRRARRRRVLDAAPPRSLGNSGRDCAQRPQAARGHVAAGAAGELRRGRSHEERKNEGRQGREIEKKERWEREGGARKEKETKKRRK